MIGSKKTVRICIAALFLLLMAIGLWHLIASDFGKKPFYDLKPSAVESAEVVYGMGPWDLWRAELNEEEIETLCALLKNVKIGRKVEMRDYIPVTAEGDKMSYEDFCLKLKSGKILRVAVERNDSVELKTRGEYFIKDFVRYEAAPGTAQVSLQLEEFNRELLRKKKCPIYFAEFE